MSYRRAPDLNGRPRLPTPAPIFAKSGFSPPLSFAKEPTPRSNQLLNP